jgi:SAM-dependent methyltransferase
VNRRVEEHIMPEWGRGYVTDVEYNDGFYGLLAPAQMALAANINGFEAPETSGAFTYCELGCGRGDTSLILAALNPAAEFHAVDFHPAHIAHARARARAAGLSNVTFHEVSFADLIGPGALRLPMFDFITMHGVWSWIAPDLQTAIIEFMRERLQPGGLVHVSFNALPGWSDRAPLQRLVKEFAATSLDRSDRAAERAIAAVKELSEAKIIPHRFSEVVDWLAGMVSSGGLSYLAHEYLNDHWQPLYHADVARAFAGAKLDFAASGDLLENFYNMVLTDQQQAMITSVAAPELRETLKDFCVDRRFRQDVYVRGARRMTVARREALLGDVRLCLRRAPPEVIQLKRPDGTVWRPDPEAYRVIVAAMAAGPMRVADLLAAPEGHRVGAVELVGVLVGTELATLHLESSPEAESAAGRFNDLAVATAGRDGDGGGLIAVPTIGLGVLLPGVLFALYEVLRRGDTPDAEALAARYVGRCQAQGRHTVIDGKEFEDPAEAQATVRDTYSQFIEGVVPIWRMMGIV